MSDPTEEEENEKLPISTSGDSNITIENDMDFGPIRATPTDIPISRMNTKGSRSNPLARTRSSNGFGCDDHDPDNTWDGSAGGNGGQRIDEKDPFEVRFDGGDSDPMCPRSMAHGRKWLVVLIVSASSFCVTCASSMYTSPSFGPLISGFINQFTTWRWTFYVLIIWSACNLSLIFSLVPETFHPVVLRAKARKIRKETGDDRWYAPNERLNKSIPKTIGYSLLRPGQLLIFEPMCLNLCVFSAILLGILYLFFGAFPLVFEGNHGFQQYQVGLAFLGLFIGMVLGAATDPFWQKNYARLIKQREQMTGEVGGSEPEYRLPPAILGACLVPIGLFFFAWTTYSSVHWVLPIIGSGIFAMGTLLVFTGIFTFLVDAYPLYAASSLAANSFMRSSFGEKVALDDGTCLGVLYFLPTTQPPTTPSSQRTLAEL
ncbi:hypothetical protein SS1G_02292 [Sclerotinia sclerotiorum 1980 UF-70]|uniref:Major facilitator superfamily (MFS) profile domain-containing protein n=1 Tax=Sclerotinia sclerotiorum (strain ATCC 18683 / 1980 / Ss-1) TaxID=665079 RepID=A7EAG0_SCLS1|nr:hypothetical protein SS1G_02292 [Sclerotinia sclerotiorum 1980 UF-70]EDN99438.1 hypothetical protein SS1G_02292 [Sclerotinia sclerotiorum 1980 UF-70]